MHNHKGSGIGYSRRLLFSTKFRPPPRIACASWSAGGLYLQLPAPAAAMAPPRGGLDLEATAACAAEHVPSPVSDCGYGLCFS
jgi:hypothetical protein